MLENLAARIWFDAFVLFCLGYLSSLLVVEIKKRTQKPKNLWAGCHDGIYVFAFRERLDTIAEKLTEGGRYYVYSAYHVHRKCAELRTSKGQVIARISVTGEVGLPSRVILTSNLPKSSKELFESLMPGKVEYRTFSC